MTGSPLPYSYATLGIYRSLLYSPQFLPLRWLSLVVF